MIDSILNGGEIQFAIPGGFLSLKANDGQPVDPNHLKLFVAQLAAEIADRSGDAPDMYQDVLDFHKKFGAVIGDKPGVPESGTVELRLKLIREEFNELTTALALDDLPGIADGVLDLVYVVLGTLVSYGIDARPIWAAIHAANMSKVGGGTRADGKVMKPAGWVPPDVEGLLRKQGWDGGNGSPAGQGEARP